MIIRLKSMCLLLESLIKKYIVRKRLQVSGKPSKSRTMPDFKTYQSLPLVIFKTRLHKHHTILDSTIKHHLVLFLRHHYHHRHYHHQWWSLMAPGSIISASHHPVSQGRQSFCWEIHAALQKGRRTGSELSLMMTMMMILIHLHNDGEPPVGVEIEVCGQRFTVGILGRIPIIAIFDHYLDCFSIVLTKWVLALLVLIKNSQ